MPAIARLTAATLALLAASVATAQITRDPPSYSAASIVNAASSDATALAPYTIVNINGANLAWDSRTMQPSDVINGNVPTALPNAGVRVWIGGEAAGILASSPTQITILVPGDLIAGPIPIQTMLDGLTGPEITINLTAVAPGIYTENSTDTDLNPLQASRPDGTPVTSDNPLLPGDQFVLHATGLGNSDPPLNPLQIPDSARLLSASSIITIYLNGVALDPSLVQTISFVPGQAGLYQLLIQLPPDAPSNPELRIGLNGIQSAPGFHLRVAPPATQTSSK